MDNLPTANQEPSPKDPAAVALGRKGGQARMAKMSKKQRHNLAVFAIRKRWGKKENKKKV